MKKFKTLRVLLLFTMLLSFFNVQRVEALSNFEILDLDVLIDVQEDGVYKITESYVLDFFAPGLGIYRDLKTKHDMSFVDESQRRIHETYYFPITDIEVDGDVYDVEHQFNGERIVIGPEDGPRFTGVKEYVIRYKVHTESFDQDGVKEAFFYNLVSDWNEAIHHFKGSVNFYKPVDLDRLIVKGQARFEEIDVSCHINSETNFSCETDELMYFGERNGITAYVPLEDDFFIRENKDASLMMIMVVSILVFIISLCIKFLGAQRLPIIEKVSFYPPKGFNAAMVKGAYAYQSFGMKGLYALLFEWANQGLIEIETGKDNVKFKKLEEIPEDREAFEKKVFGIFFKETNKYYTSKDWQKERIYDSLLMQMNAVMLAVNKKGEAYNKKSKTRSYVILFMTSLAYFVLMLMILSPHFYNLSRTIILSVVLGIGFTLISIFFTISIKHYMHTNRKKDASIMSLVFVVAFLGLSFLEPRIIRSVIGIKVSVIQILVVNVFSSLSIVCAAFTEVKTQFGSDLMGEILGLRNFIKFAKKDELLAMQEENPSLYYDVLPYAYVFDMSDLWLDHFKEIEIPSSVYYRSYNPTFTNYMMMRSLSRSMTSMPSRVIPANMTSSKGGGTFGGGGFSGGGFSGGGGFGGGGGGGR